MGATDTTNGDDCGGVAVYVPNPNPNPNQDEPRIVVVEHVLVGCALEREYPGRGQDEWPPSDCDVADPWWDCPACGEPTRLCRGPRLPAVRACSDCDWSFTFPEPEDA